jgi:hypothetical protein
MAGSEGCGYERNEVEKLRQGTMLHLGVKGVDDDEER